MKYKVYLADDHGDYRYLGNVKRLAELRDVAKLPYTNGARFIRARDVLGGLRAEYNPRTDRLFITPK